MSILVIGIYSFKTYDDVYEKKYTYSKLIDITKPIGLNVKISKS